MCDVSIIIPTYNRLWCLPIAIESCRNSDCKTEIIVVDDGSTDGTWDWLSQQKDVISIKQKNQGQTYAANAGTALAKGKYIRFLDSDDFLELGIIDKQFIAAELENADLVYSKVDSFDFETKTVKKYPEINKWRDFVEVQLSNQYGSHYLGMLFKTDLVKKTPRRADFALRDDRMFLLEYALLNPTISFVAGCAGYWVVHRNQMQANYNGLKAQVANYQSLKIFKTILSALEQKGDLTLARKKAACSSLWPLATWIAKNHKQEGLNVYKWILELYPEFKIPEKSFLGLCYNIFGFALTQHLLSLRRNLKSLI